MSRLYSSLLRPLLFRMDPEQAHRLAVGACGALGHVPIARELVRSAHRVVDPRLRQTIAGLTFEHPVGLAAGFDKNGSAIDLLGALGFGHVEIGSVSAYPSKGNPRPRLFRIPEDEGIVVHYGVPNDGAETVARRIAKRPRKVPLGVSLVKTNDPLRLPTDDEVLADYAASFSRLQPHADYVAINLSCPNSANDRIFFDELAKVELLLRRIRDLEPCVPVFLKLKPSTDTGFLRELVAVVDPFDFVVGFGINLPSGKPASLDLPRSRERVAMLPGAVSGRPVEALINANLRLLFQAIGGNSRFRLMAAGGVFDAEDAYRKIRLGASLVQLYTALVYRGPGIAKEIAKGLIPLLERDGFDRVSHAVGIDAA